MFSNNLLFLLLSTATISFAAIRKEWQFVFGQDNEALSHGGKHPNILFIMADDLGWNDVSWHNQHMHTPNIEHLAHNNAALLTQAYVNRLCSITRSAFLAGYYPFHMGTQNRGFRFMEPAGVPLEFKFFPEFLQEADYETYLVGKWHLGYCREELLPTSRGFEHFRGIHNGMTDYFNHSFTYKNKYTGLDFWDKRSPRFNHNGTYATEVYTADVKELLEKRNTDRPFFLYLAYQVPHKPYQVPEKYLEPCKQNNTDRRIYCGMVNAMDESIGKTIQLLKDLNYYDDTVIMFSSDNGGDPTHGSGNNYPFRGGKATLWEGGTHIVSFVHSPKYIINAGPRKQLFSIVDWFPTILFIAGLPYKKYGDGINQRMITDDKEPIVGERTSLVYNIWPSGSAIRRGKYKLIMGDPGRKRGWGWTPPPDQGVAESAKNENDGIWLFDIESNWQLRKVLMDCEFAAIDAAEEVFGVTVQNCLFHFAAAVKNYIKGNGLQAAYGQKPLDENELYQWGRKLFALSMIR